jgi:DNA-binding response OmpR family regulator
MDDAITGKKFLIVEDNTVIGLDLKANLADSGAAAEQVTTSEEALDLLASSRFDAAILDVHLRDGNSYSIADELRRLNTPFVFLSGYLTVREGYTDVPFLPKPYNAAAVLTALAELIGAKA